MRPYVVANCDQNMNICRWMKTKNSICNPLHYKMISNVQVAISLKFMSELGNPLKTHYPVGIWKDHSVPQFEVKEISVTINESMTYIKFMSD